MMKLIANQDGITIVYESGRKVVIGIGGYGINITAEQPVTTTTATDVDGGTRTSVNYETAEGFELHHSGYWWNAEPTDDDEAGAP